MPRLDETFRSCATTEKRDGLVDAHVPWYNLPVPRPDAEQEARMKNIVIAIAAPALALLLSACAKPANLERMETGHGDGYLTVVWGGRTYLPYCAISPRSRGRQIGIIDGDRRHRAYEFKGHSADEWLITVHVSGLMDGAMLMREASVADIPAGLHSEYEWNSPPERTAEPPEETVTFIGTIIGSGLGDIRPTIRVKPGKGTIPHDEVLFELSAADEEWAGKVGDVVIITCSAAFSEQPPHCGTLVSIHGWKQPAPR